MLRCQVVASHSLVLLISVFLPRIPFTCSFAWTLPHRIRTSLQRPASQILSKAIEDQEDWREFRAKLVQQNQDINNPTSQSSSSWAFEAGTLIERGSIVLSRVESSLGCHDLRQPYFHKCAVLVLEHDEDSTRGIILNRPSNLVCSDADLLLLEEEDDDDTASIPNPDNSWQLNFGGDISGLFSDEPMIVALHSLNNSTLAKGCSDEILPNLWVTSHSGARSLIAANEASCDDFFSFYGFSLWEPGQLQLEVDRGSWYIVSMDSKSILDSLQQLRHDDNQPQGAGVSYWEDWIGRIQKQKEERVEESRDAFSDLMLKEWCQEMVCVADDAGDAEIDVNFNLFEALENAAEDAVGPGSLVQATSNPSTYMLFDQLFHKATMLLLKEEEDFSLGLILNLPTIDSYAHTLPDGKNVRIPIRYGGPLGDEDDGDDNGLTTMNDGVSRIVWLHSNSKLRDMKVGQSISGQSPIWTCSQIQALNAIDIGLAKAGDFLAIDGYVMWEKEMGVGGIAGQIVSGALRQVEMDCIGDIWAVLGTQSALQCLDDIDSTFASMRDAWELGQGKEDAVSSVEDDEEPPRCVHATNVTLPEFADEALRKWIEIFLLDNRKYVRF